MEYVVDLGTNMRLTLRWIALVAVTLVVPVLAAQAYAPASASNTAAAAVDAQMTDAEAIARDLDLPVTTVTIQLGYQELIDSIDFAKLDAGYAAISSRLGEPFAITYASKGTPPAAVSDALASVGLLKFTTMKSVPFTASELARAQDQVIARLRSQGIVADTSNDPFLGHVSVVTAQPPSEQAQLAVENATGGVGVKWTTGHLSVPGAAYGGYKLNDPNTGTYCTAGFVVVNLATNDRGLATAGHCDNAMYYAVIGQQLNIKAENFYGTGDFQWHDKGGVTWGARVFDGSGTRPIYGLRNTANMNFGDQVVKYGVTTGFTTGTIVDKSYCPSYVPSCAPTFVLADKNGGGYMFDHGDSGGPVMLNNVAYGFGSGGPGSLPNATMIFAPQQYTQGVLNIKVLTQ